MQRTIYVCVLTPAEGKFSTVFRMGIFSKKLEEM